MTTSDSYRIRKTSYTTTNPDSYIDLDPGTVNSTATDLTFVGKIRPLYGKSYNENVLHLLENFASPEADVTATLYNAGSTPQSKRAVAHDFSATPKYLSSPVNGQTWFNTTRKILYVYFDGRWRPITYKGNIQTNWGCTTNGQALPKPSDVNYSECYMVVSPLNIPGQATSISCSVNYDTGVVTSTYNTSGASNIPAEAMYMIVYNRASNVLNGRTFRATHTTTDPIGNPTLINQLVTTTNVTSFEQTTTHSVSVGAANTTGSPNLSFTWYRASPPDEAGMSITLVNSAGTPVSLEVATPGVGAGAAAVSTVKFKISATSSTFPAGTRVRRSAAFLCLVHDTVSGAQIMSLPIRVEFTNFSVTGS